MQADSTFQIFGPISIALMWAMIGLLLYRWPGKPSMSISQHAAAHKNIHLLYASVLSISLILFFVFILQWFVPYFNLPAAATVVLTIGLLLEFAATWIAETGEYKAKLHQALSYGAALLIPFLTAVIIFLPAVSSAAKIVAGIAFIFMFICLFLFLFVKKTHAKYLWFQASYLAAFHLTILATTYLR